MEDAGPVRPVVVLVACGLRQMSWCIQAGPVHGTRFLRPTAHWRMQIEQV